MLGRDQEGFGAEPVELEDPFPRPAGVPLVDHEKPGLAQPPHRALPDAYVTAWLFIELLKHKTPDEMVVISRYPALLRRITFGKKAKGQTYEEAPLDYLRWIMDESDLNEDTKFSARYWIQKRTRQKEAEGK